ncbi:MAG: hypothetical protein ABL936_00460 [Aestuariivirga sp.]
MAEATAKELTAATAPQEERRVSLKLFNDVWIKDPKHPDATPDGIRRVRTNIVSLDDDGNPLIDKKTRNFVSTQIVADIPLSVAKKLIEDKKAERMDPL